MGAFADAVSFGYPSLLANGFSWGALRPEWYALTGHVRNFGTGGEGATGSPASMEDPVIA